MTEFTTGGRGEGRKYFVFPIDRERAEYQAPGATRDGELPCIEATQMWGGGAGGLGDLQFVLQETVQPMCQGFLISSQPVKHAGKKAFPQKGLKAPLRG